MKPLINLNPGDDVYIIDFTSKESCDFLLEMGCFPGDRIRIRYINDEIVGAQVNFKSIYIPFELAHNILTHPINLVICLN